jgi:hypothetical protein
VRVLNDLFPCLLLVFERWQRCLTVEDGRLITAGDLLNQLELQVLVNVHVSEDGLEQIRFLTNTEVLDVLTWAGIFVNIPL